MIANKHPIWQQINMTTQLPIMKDFGGLMYTKVLAGTSGSVYVWLEMKIFEK